MAQIEIKKYENYTTDDTGRVTGATVIYKVNNPGSSDPAAIVALVNSSAPELLGNARKSSLTLSSCDPGSTPAQALVAVSYEYSAGSAPADAEESAEAVLNFECTTSSAHVVRALKQTSIIGKINANNFINWNGKTGDLSQVEGVDVLVPVMRESYVKVFKKSAITTSYKRKIGKLTGRVNKSSFKGWDAGEVLFCGASYSAAQSDSEITVTFQFAIQPNEAQYKLGSTTVNKKGFEYISVAQKTSGSNVVIEFAHLNQVYPYADFGELGI